MSIATPVYKKYIYRVYGSDNTYLGTLDNVESPFGYLQRINESAAELRISLRNTLDDLGAGIDTDLLVDENGNYVVDENGNRILTRLDYILSGVPIDIANRVIVTMYNETHPNGLDVFDGVITSWETSTDGDRVDISVISWGVQLDNYLITTSPISIAVDQSTYDSEEVLAPYFSELGSPIAQSFTLGSAFSIDSIIIWARKSSSGGTFLAWNLYAGTPSAPGELLKSGTFSINSTTISEHVLRFNQAAQMPIGEYFFEIINYGSYASGWAVPYISYASGAPYAGGTMWIGEYVGPKQRNYVDNSTDLAFKLNVSLGETTVDFNQADPGSMARRIGLQLSQQGSKLLYSTDSIELTNTSSDYQYILASGLDGIKKAVELSPSRWWWFVDVATRYIHLHPQSTVPDHTFIKGRHLSKVDIKRTLENITNDVYFSGGEVDNENLFVHVDNPPSIQQYGRWLARRSDNRVTVEASAITLATGVLYENQEPRYVAHVTIPASSYDIESIRVGDMTRIAGFNELISSLLLQVVGVSMGEQEVSLELGWPEPIMPKRIEDLARRLEQQETINNPSAATNI